MGGRPEARRPFTVDRYEPSGGPASASAVSGIAAAARAVSRTTRALTSPRLGRGMRDMRFLPSRRGLSAPPEGAPRKSVAADFRPLIRCH